MAKKLKIKKGESLAEFFIRYADAPENDDKTVNDFFKAAGVPKNERSDFAFTAILKQVQEIEEEEKCA